MQLIIKLSYIIVKNIILYIGGEFGNNFPKKGKNEKRFKPLAQSLKIH